ncbi:MAG: ribosomal protein S18-alanine N-acetyltransferase [Deltaproteobacteria bacterium]|nr:ribosomal protein S18-alanine N-acetyltransferase [Deltaproteobacteria bacterium]MCD6138067.1 ribosomal protein S18-alanine N-acetyltransferase [Deltaproteobacteria bacterium]RLB91250.1 MAG: ribosomal-protein-alanine N-acetyltransferase [Deltaproteobacteria bacterium]RLB92702.1 MAG: ribosomal-protein-alanine N-acetyltransferase [Deltaproteobacteria bacterium]RLC08948.1 MAG: ribosomal-protein-alanine N-acetyltransferase [Deltaproteobacteria bacterium]
MYQADIESALEIEAVSFPAPWHRISFETELLEDTSHNLVVRQKRAGEPDRLIAYLFFRLACEEMHVVNLAVDPAYRRRGVARFLLQYALGMAKKRGMKRAYLEVRPSNYPAISLYEKLGFSPVAVRPRYYVETSEAAIIMVKKID